MTTLAPERTERLLEKSGRITPREVLEAYEQTGLKPIQNIYYTDVDEQARACAMGALAAAHGSYDDDPFTYMEDRMGEDWERYLESFACAFDNYRFAPGHHDWKAYLDGQRSRKAVLGA